MSSTTEPKSRRALVFGLLGIGALAGGLFVGRRFAANGPQVQEPKTASRASEALFALTLPDANGVATSLARWKGSALVVNFWATWCAPCVAEMPDLQQLRDQYAPRGAEILGIGIDNAQAIAEFGKRLGITYPLLVGGYGATELARQFGNANGGLPFTVVLDRAGAVRSTQIGRIRAENLRSIIETALA